MTDGAGVQRSDFKRFFEKLRFEPSTGCVVWTAGTSSGRAGEVRYGAFAYKRKRWTAQRWAAKFIHEIPIDNCEAQHTCSNTLCVHHVTAGAEPNGNGRQHWLLVSLGYGGEWEPEEGWEDEPKPLVIHQPPEWFTKMQEEFEDG